MPDPTKEAAEASQTETRKAQVTEKAATKVKEIDDIRTLPTTGMPPFTSAPQSFFTTATNRLGAVKQLHSLCDLRKNGELPRFSSLTWQSRIKTKPPGKQHGLLTVSAVSFGHKALPLDGSGPDVKQADPSAVQFGN